MQNPRRRKISLGLATLCLALSVLNVAQAYNKAVQKEQFDQQMNAEGGSDFNVYVLTYGYENRNRNLILVLCIAGFFLSLVPRTAMFSLIPHGLTLPLTFQWVGAKVEALATNEYYLGDSPYLLRIATQAEWALFLALAVTVLVNSYFLLTRVRRA